LVLARVAHSQTLSESIAVARDAVDSALPACEIGSQTEPSTALCAFSLDIAQHAVLSRTSLTGAVVKVKTFLTFLAELCGDGALFTVNVTACDAGCLVEEESSFAGSTR
jgi:hypothetical protein